MDGINIYCQVLENRAISRKMLKIRNKTYRNQLYAYTFVCRSRCKSETRIHEKKVDFVTKSVKIASSQTTT